MASEHQTQRERERGREHEGDRAEKYAKRIDSLDQHEDYHGQTLVTQSHDVIRRWAEERGAEPATVPGSRHEDHVGVLRLDFPGYGGDKLEHISWDEWFRAFDERGLKFIYQEHLRDGRQSNFFRLENPDREDG